MLPIVRVKEKVLAYGTYEIERFFKIIFLKIFVLRKFVRSTLPISRPEEPALSERICTVILASFFFLLHDCSWILFNTHG